MNERLSNIINSPNRSSVIGGVLAFGAGIGFGYILGKRSGGPTYHVIPAVDFPKATTEEFTHLERSDHTDKGENFLKSKMEELVITPDPEEESEPVVTNIFSSNGNDDDDWDYDEELKKRNTGEPYVIHRDEFHGNEMDYTQSTLTYYAGDDIMTDEDDVPIFNHSTIVGDLLFGHGSGDPNVVHVRNDKLKGEYEILRDEGLYSIVIAGLELEDNQRVKDIQHSHNRKFKEE